MDPIADALLDTFSDDPLVAEMLEGSRPVPDSEDGLSFPQVVGGMLGDRDASFRRDVWKEGWSISASGIKRYERDDSFPIHISKGEVHIPWNPCLDDLTAKDWRRYRGLNTPRGSSLRGIRPFIIGGG